MSDPTQNTRARDALRGEWRRGMQIVLADGGVGTVWDVRSGRVWVAWDRDDDPPEVAVYTPSETVRYEFAPDLDDDVTEVALIAVIEARVGPVSVVVREESDGDREYAVQVPLVYGSREIGFGPTRKDALLAALEAT